MDKESKSHVVIVINMFRVKRITCKVLNQPKWDDLAPEHEFWIARHVYPTQMITYPCWGACNNIRGFDRIWTICGVFRLLGIMKPRFLQVKTAIIGLDMMKFVSHSFSVMLSISVHPIWNPFQVGWNVEKWLCHATQLLKSSRVGQLKMNKRVCLYFVLLDFWRLFWAF